MKTLTPSAAGTSPGINAPSGALDSAAPIRARLHWVDCCKGICIILVVYGHVTGGLEASGIVANGSAYDLFRSWVYLFHMPAFFFLSGLFAAKALQRPWREVIAGKLSSLAYPYVLWTGIYLAVQELMARYANNPPDAGQALRFLWQPYGYGLWFLYSLFLISLLFHGAVLTRARREVILFFAVVVHLAAAFEAFGFWPILDLALLNFVYYAVGGLYADQIFAGLASGRGFVFLIASSLGLGLMTGLAVVLRAHVYADLLPAFLGVAGVTCLARGVVDSLAGHFLSLLGFFSLEIYLGHALFGTASRAILTKCGIHGALPMVVSGVLIGLFASLAVAVLCQKIGFPYLYRWPRRNVRLSPRSA